MPSGAERQINQWRAQGAVKCHDSSGKQVVVQCSAVRYPLCSMEQWSDSTVHVVHPSRGTCRPARAVQATSVLPNTVATLPTYQR